ncbi:hypothetical protein GW17_00034288 [Ensete ventricosum]|nr:hypothetical protein GW17_00034288 [Ensete ventricosum]
MVATTSNSLLVRSTRHGASYEAYTTCCCSTSFGVVSCRLVWFRATYTVRRRPVLFDVVLYDLKQLVRLETILCNLEYGFGCRRFWCLLIQTRCPSTAVVTSIPTGALKNTAWQKRRSSNSSATSSTTNLEGPVGVGEVEREQLLPLAEELLVDEVREEKRQLFDSRGEMRACSKQANWIERSIESARACGKEIERAEGGKQRAVPIYSTLARADSELSRA